MYGDLVSIIMPTFNCQDYIKETIESVIKQTYSNWELVITDDCSNDKTFEMLCEYEREDPRIIVLRLEQNKGAAMARNNSIREAHGTYLAFLDSDDIWNETKLEKQIRFMNDNGYCFTCTSYGKIDEKSNILSKNCLARKIYDYKTMLKYCPGNSTIIYDCKKTGKVEGPDIRRRNDFAMFLKVIKRAENAYGMNEILGYHRVRNGSISVSKRKVLYYQWLVYYRFEHLGIIRSAYYTIFKIVQTLLNKNG